MRIFSCNYRRLRKSGYAIGLINIFTRSNNENDLSATEDLHSRLQQAYQKDDVRLVRRTTVLIDLLVHYTPVAVICERWGLSPACLYAWQKAFLLHGLDSLVYHHGGGRQPKLILRQKKRLVELIEAGPQVVGLETACWNSVGLGLWL